LTGVYTHSLQTINGCDSIIHLNLKVNPIYKDTIRATICQGQTYNLHGFNQTTSGIYYDTLQTTNGCDSILILDLLVNPTYNQHIYADICQGQTYNLNGFTESATGIYYDTLQTINGCDSVKTLHLTVHQNYNDTIFADICENQTYTLNGFNEHLAGNYTKHLQSIYGCDSVVTLSLKVYPTYHTDILAEICQGETYNLNGFNQSASGIYYDTVQSIYGCDSVKKLVLIVYPTYDTTITASICWGQNYTDNGFNVGQTGIYHDTLQSIHGCDSVVNLDLTAIVYNRTIETTICQGGTYNFHGMILNQAGTYTDTLHSVVNGCDSIITLKLKLNLPYNDTIRATICQGEMYDAFGFHETNAGYHPRLLQSQGGCDSLVVLDLTVNPSYKQVINASICPGERYNFHGFTLTQQGTYKDTLQSINGCDSITVLRLNINPKYNDTIKASICQGETYTLNGFNENRTGYYVHSLQTTNGCDSVVTLKLTVNPKKTINIDANICQGDVYNSNDFYVDTTGNYTRVVQDINGCDSTIILHLTVNPSYRDTIEADIKAGETYRGYGFDENNTGYYEHYLQTIHGCDSSMVLHLVVNDPTHVYVPNAFTPADKTNNVFYAYTDEKDIRLSSFKIYDRWGEKVFETDDIKIGWDGRYKGNLCQQGAYIYYIEYYTIDSPNKKLKKKGTLMLLY
jgi:gliding motility-associated-like protein